MRPEQAKLKLKVTFHDSQTPLTALFPDLVTEASVPEIWLHCQAQCFTFRDRIYNNGSDIDSNFATTRRRRCPAAAPNGNANLAPLDLVTPNSFDYNYFKNLVQKKGLLDSDQVLFSGGSTDSIVSEYSSKPATFRSDFGIAMIKMGDVSPLTGSAGRSEGFALLSTKPFLSPKNQDEMYNLI
ncbi:lignin-forming anionic peroxidase [Prunus yedoensis var. nudiflora]|uniref:peroxidase n=1 Tax=Prunus yedoensis var. nudiflora TaxID=2094558 RepID=A0A314XVP0_PRUYE|nr:lignin-forming anionic peroxidase [Prunus yedoensis var. nudiflora]